MSETIKNNFKEKQVAVILFNLGGPDNLESVKPFLFSLFSDKYILRLPKFFRITLAWVISTLRNKTAQEIYSQIGGKSSLLEETRKQQKELQKELDLRNGDSKFLVEICMRHWHPKAFNVVSKLKKKTLSEIILLPLYPQYSTTTTKSSLEDFNNELQVHGLGDIKTKTICCYPIAKNFITAHGKLVKKHIEKQQKNKDYRVLFSAHGLPSKIIKSGDPYQMQVECTVKAIVNYLKIENLDYRICYQSRVGPVEWIGPNTEDEIKLAGEEQKNLVVVPVAFVSEHVETLVELDIEYKEIAEKYNIDFTRVPTLSVDNIFISFLADMVESFHQKSSSIIGPPESQKICNKDFFSECPCIDR